jgi:hypothetical protein
MNRWALERAVMYTKEGTRAPVLYDARGNPLTYTKPKMGFNPERIENAKKV